MINGCEDGETEMLAFGDAVCVERHGCEAPVRLCTIDGGGHTWPGGLPVPLPGHTSDDLDATDVMLDWFDDNPMRGESLTHSRVHSTRTTNGNVCAPSARCVAK